jgi:hypothetical protein
MKKLIIFAIALFVNLTIFTSCKSDISENLAPANTPAKFDNSILSDPTIMSDYVVRDGAVHFRDVESYRKVAPNLPEFALKLKKDYPQFESLESLNIKALKSLENAKSMEEIDKKIEANSKYLLKDGSQGKTRTDGVITSILNGDGIYYVGKVLYFYKNNKNFIIKNGDMAEIEKINKGVLSSKNISTFDYLSSSKKNKSARTEFSSKSSGQFPNQYRVQYLVYDYFNINFIGVNSSGENLYDAFAYVTCGGASSKTYWQDGAGQPFNSFLTLKVNYRATISIFGNVVVSQEPNFTSYAYGDYINDNRFIGYRLLTQTELNSNAATTNWESRGGFISSSQVSALNY